MTTRFTQLFEIQLEHAFYKDGRCPDMQLVPTPATQQHFQKLGLLFKPHASGAHILYKFTEGESTVIQSFSAPFTLSFLLLSKNPTFLNFTDLPIEQKPIQYYFSNASKQANSEGKIKLNQGDFVSVDDVGSFTGAVFPIEVNAEKEKKVNLKMNNAADELLLEEIVEDQQYYHLDLSKQEPGKYSISVDDQAPSSFYYEPALNAQHFGLIKLQIDGQDQSFFDSQKKVVFALQFKTRSTTWRYHIVNQQAAPNQEYKIIDKTNSVQFTEGEEVNLPNGSNAMRFDSIDDAETKEGVSLQERYSGHFQLELYGAVQQLGGRRSKKTMILPNAGPQQVRIEKSDEGLRAYSDIYVYV